MVEFLAAPQPGEDLFLFGSAIGRHDEKDVRSDSLRRGVAEEPIARVRSCAGAQGFRMLA